MLAVIAFILFTLGFLFHGFGFAPNAWISWQSLLLAGLALLALHAAGVGRSLPVIVRRRAE